MPWPYFLAVIVVIALYIAADACFDVSARIARALRPRLQRAKALRGGAVVVETPAPSPPLQPAAPRPRNWMPLAQLCALFAVIALIGALAAGALGRFSKSPGEVRADFRADVAASAKATADASVNQARRAVARVEAHSAELARLEREVNDARHAIADAPDLDARLAAAADFYERMRLEAETTRAAALRDFDSPIVS